ncbi:MAG: hypothetical protein H6Q72_1244 [Firmicutes bacterium]|nr:hypothetical protein [Bacillota bacterium]
MKKPMSSCLLYKVFPTTYLSVLLLALMFPAGLWLPTSWGWENGVIENLQILILAAGLVVSCFVAWNKRDDRKSRNLWLCLTPCWILAILREVSWGRIFYPVSIGTHGPEFITLQQLPYGFLVKPFVIIVIVVTLIAVYWNAKGIFICHKQLPVLDLTILLVAAIMAVLCDKNMLLHLHSYHQILEELAELTVYWSMVSIVMNIGLQKKNTSLEPIKKTSSIKITIYNKKDYFLHKER